MFAAIGAVTWGQATTGVSGVVTGRGQLVVVQLLPAVPPLCVQDATGTFTLVLGPAEQLVEVQLLSKVAALVVHSCTGTLTVGTTGQVVVTPTFWPELLSVRKPGVHVPGAVGVGPGTTPGTATVEQVVAVQLLA